MIHLWSWGNETYRHSRTQSTRVQAVTDATTHSAWSAFCPPQEHSPRQQRWLFRPAGPLRSYRSWHRADRGRTQSRCWWAARRCPSADAPSLPSSPRVRCRSSTAPRPRSWRLPLAHTLPGTWQTATLHLMESSEKKEHVNRKHWLKKRWEVGLLEWTVGSK